MTVEPTALPARVSWRTRARHLPAAVWLCGIVAFSVAIRALLAKTASVPAIFPDELVYWELSRGIGESGRLAMRDEAVSAWTYGPLYPLVISPAHLVTSSLVDAYAVVKAINAVLFSLAAIPAYYLARRLVSERTALLAAALALIVPSALYSTRVMAESLAYPLFLVAVLAMIRVLERPSWSRQLVAVLAILFASLTRAELVVLFPALATTVLVLAWRDGQPARRRLSRFLPTWIALTAACAAGVALAAFGAAGPHIGLLGDVEPLRIPGNVVWHVANLDLYSGVIPFAAFALAVIATLRSRGSTEGTALIVLAACVTAWLIVVAATFESGLELYGVYSTHVFDRYVFYVVPLFLIALLAWAEKGIPTGRRLIAGVAAAAALLPLTLPFESLLHGREWGTCTCSVGLVPMVWTKALVGDGIALRGVLLVFTSALALAFMRTTGRWAVTRAAIYLLLLFSVMAGTSNWLLSEDAREAGVGELTWVDDAVVPGSTVAILWRGDRVLPPSHRTALRQTEFFNRTVGPVYDLRHPLAGGVPSTPVVIRGDLVVDSAGNPVRAGYVIAHRSLAVKGRPIARDPSSGIVLYRTDGPVRAVEPGP
jgi:hypothetical protein